MRFIISRHLQAIVDLNEKTDIVVHVGGSKFAARDAVYIYIEYLFTDQLYITRGQPGFFVCFAQGYTINVMISISMATRLKPLIMFAVMK